MAQLGFSDQIGPARRALLVGVAAAALGMGAMPVHAQQANLRGEVAESVVVDGLLTRRRLADRPGVLDAPPGATPDATYVPAAAEEAEEERARLFEPLDPDVAAPGERPEEAERVAVRRRTPQEPPVEEPEPEPEAVEAEGVRTPRVDAVDETVTGRIEPENARVEPIQGRDPLFEEDPFAPLGLRLGTFTLNPTLEQGLSWTSNANSSPVAEPALISETTLRLNAISDWSRHSAIINAFGTYRRSIDGVEVKEPSFGVDATFTADIRDGLRGIARASYALRPEAADSPVILPVTVSRPLLHTITGGLGLEKDLGKLRVSARADVEGLVYDDAKLDGGGTLSQRERNSILYTGALRLGYAVSPAITPFAEVEAGRRNYEVEIDSAGYARSSDRFAARAGVELDLGEKLVGELSAGWISETFDDDRLVPISGLSAAANLTWSPYRGTIVGFEASTTVEGTTTPGESGSLLHAATLRLERRMRANLTANASLGASWRDYSGSTDHDLILRAETSMTWWLNRYAGVTGRYRFETLDSTLPNRDTTTNSVYLGVTLRR